MKVTLQQLVELSREVEISDPIEWGELHINEETVYEMMALSVMEMVLGVNDTASDIDRELILMASLTKLMVENFVLNLELARV